jgi:heat-inducible transcriptional repressor
MLTERQRMLLEMVVDAHVKLGRPVGSKWLAEQPSVDWSPSTIRYELAELEGQGLLNHPHTSAGRVPTDAGYRIYADALLREGPQPSDRGDMFELELSTMRREVDAAMRATTETLSQVTDLLAAISAPPLHTATIKRVEVLLLQEHVALVVIITSTGAVTKRAFTFDDPIDPGLADWSASYLNESLGGTDLGALTLRSKLAAPDLSPKEAEFLETISPAFSDLAETVEQTVYVEGAARLVAGRGFEDLSDMNNLLRMLERRVSLLTVLRSALAAPSVFLGIGHENQAPELRSASIVAASYGLGHRTLGTVSVIGPVRMDYRRAIGSVRAAAHALSGFVEEVYQ